MASLWGSRRKWDDSRMKLRDVKRAYRRMVVVVERKVVCGGETFIVVWKESLGTGRERK